MTTGSSEAPAATRGLGRRERHQQPRHSGHSKFNWWTDTRRYLRQVVRMVLMYNPLKVLMPIGLTLLGVGTGKLMVQLTKPKDEVDPASL